MIAALPSPPDFQVSFTSRSPGTAPRTVGAGGAVGPEADGVTGFDGPLPAPSPAEFTARTWNVYSVPLVSVVAVWLVVEAPLPGTSVQSPQAPSPAFWRTSQLVMAAPPLPPAVQASATWALPAVARGREGASGGFAPGVAVASRPQSLAPAALAARTRTVYAVPSVRLAIVWLAPVTVACRALP